MKLLMYLVWTLNVDGCEYVIDKDPFKIIEVKVIDHNLELESTYIDEEEYECPCLREVR